MGKIAIFTIFNKCRQQSPIPARRLRASYALSRRAWKWAAAFPLGEEEAEVSGRGALCLDVT